MDRSCGGGKTVGGFGSVPCSWSNLRSLRFRSVFTWRSTIAVPAAVAVPPIAEAAAAITAVTEATAATIVALAVAIDFPHHRGWAFLVFLDAHGQVAQNVFIETLLPLD